MAEACGLFVDMEKGGSAFITCTCTSDAAGYLAGSPDGVVGEDRLVEVGGPMGGVKQP